MHYRDDQNRDDVRDLDHRVDRRAGRVLVGIADRVAGHRRFVRGRAFATVGAVLDQLLRVVPGAAAGGHADCLEEADDDDADQEATERVDAEQTDDHRDDDRDQGRRDHLFLRGQGDDADRFAVLGLFGPLHNPRVVFELFADLLDHLPAGAADGLDRQSGEQVDHHAADDQPDQHVRAGQVEEPVEVVPLRGFVGELALEGGEQHQRRERGGADRVTLGHGLGGVADRVERVGDVADVLRQLRHLGDAAGVVGDRPEGVEGDDQTAERELGHHGDADAVDAGELVGAEDRQGDDERRGGGRLEALGEALDDVRRVPGLGGAGDRLHRPEPGRRIKFGNHEEQRRDCDADHRAEPAVGDRDRGGGLVEHADPERIAHQPVGDRVEGRDRDHAGQDHALVERALDAVGFGPHHEGADDRGDDRDAADDQRVDRDLAGEVTVEGEDAEQHHRDRGDRVGLEQVGGHAGAVADVVADVVGDNRLDLADQVGADVGGLGEDAAAQPGEDRDQRTTEAEADQRVDGLLVGAADQEQEAVVAGDADQRQTDDQQAGHRAALEGDVERRRNAAARRLGDARVGPHRDVHPDEAGGAREHGPDQEPDRGFPVLQQQQQDRDRHRERGDDRVLAAEVGLGPFLDGARDFAHAVVAGRLGEQALGNEKSIENGSASADQRDDNSVIGQKFGQSSYSSGGFSGAGVYRLRRRRAPRRALEGDLRPPAAAQEGSEACAPA